MSTACGKFGLFTGGSDTILLSRNCRGRLKSDTKINLFTVGNPPLDSAGKIRACANTAAALLEGVIVFRTAHARRGEPGTNFEAFGGGEAQHRFGEISFEFVENGFAQPRRNISRNTLNHATKRIAVSTRLLNEIDHVLCDRLVGTSNNRGFHVRGFNFQSVNLRDDVVNLCDEGDNFDFWKKSGQYFARDGSGGDATDCFPRTGASTALPVANSVLGLVSEIGVRGTKSFAHRFIGFRTGVLVSNENCYRGAESSALENAGQDFATIRLVAWSRDFALTGAPTIEFLLNIRV